LDDGGIRSGGVADGDRRDLDIGFPSWASLGVHTQLVSLSLFRGF
jgi:hypothetical protein